MNMLRDSRFHQVHSSERNTFTFRIHILILPPRQSKAWRTGDLLRATTRTIARTTISLTTIARTAAQYQTVDRMLTPSKRIAFGMRLECWKRRRGSWRRRANIRWRMTFVGKRVNSIVGLAVKVMICCDDELPGNITSPLIEKVVFSTIDLSRFTSRDDRDGWSRCSSCDRVVRRPVPGPADVAMSFCRGSCIGRPRRAVHPRPRRDLR